MLTLGFVSINAMYIFYYAYYVMVILNVCCIILVRSSKSKRHATGIPSILGYSALNVG